MKPIQIISQDVFDKIRSRFQNLEMGDETGAVTIDPAQARFFDFDFVSEGADLGRVSISLNDLGSLKIYYSQGITENQDDPAKKMWYSFLKEMRFFAMRRLLRFDTRDITKTNLDRNDFQYLASKGTEDEEMMNQMNESRWSQKSTKKTSRAVKGGTEVIVRHNRSVDEMYPGARSQRKNIKAIFIQNQAGERYKYPFIHPAGAFAMAQHIDHGGVPHDPGGKAIMRMSEQIAQLQEFSRQVQRSQLHDDAMGIADRAQGRLNELKSMIEALGKRHHYENWISEFDDSGIDDGLGELDPVTMEDYKTKFTQTNFKEELAQYFPLIHKIMQETNTIDLEEYVGEGEECAKCHQDPCECDDDKIGESVDDFAQFEAWAEAVEKGELSPKQIADLKQALTDLQVPLDLGTAYNFFNQFGIDDEALEKAFRDEALRSEELRAEPIEVFKSWATDNYGELLLALGMSGTEAPAPAEAPAEEPAPEVGAQPEEQPVAEGPGRMINGKEIDMRSLEVDGVDSRDYPDFSDAYISYALFIDGSELSDEEMDQLNDEHGDLVHDLAYDSLHENEKMVPNQDSMETKDPKAMIKEVAKIVKQFYNEDTPEVGPFRGEEGILLDVEKQISEKFGEEAGHRARQIAEAFMEKLTKQWEERHGKSGKVGAVDSDDGLARLKELLGNIKQKVEGIGDQGMGGRDFNKNIISAEDSKSDFRTHGMDSGPNKEKPMSFKRDPIQATTDKAHDMGTALLQKLAGIRKK
jgi:hypothetical protein